jgi:predicted  nucleic acid-binding Zn-ribbon protein
MAGLGLKIDVQKFEKLVKLKEEIEKLKETLRSMDRATDTKNFDALNKKLQQAQRESEKLSEKLIRQANATRAAGLEAREAVSDFDRFQKLNGSF